MPWQGQSRIRVAGVSLEIVRAGPSSKVFPGSVLLGAGLVLMSWVVGFGLSRSRLVRLDLGLVEMNRKVVEIGLVRV